MCFAHTRLASSWRHRRGGGSAAYSLVIHKFATPVFPLSDLRRPQDIKPTLCQRGTLHDTVGAWVSLIPLP